MAGAGFVLYREFHDGIKFLGLIGPEFHQKRCDGKYDVPKGVVDDSDNTHFDTAVREAWEEAGYAITNNVVQAGPYKDGLLSIWLAQVFKDPVIKPNPETGIVEHNGYDWLTPEELSKNCYNYLTPSILWASGIIKGVNERKRT